MAMLTLFTYQKIAIECTKIEQKQLCFHVIAALIISKPKGKWTEPNESKWAQNEYFNKHPRNRILSVFNCVNHFL